MACHSEKPTTSETSLSFPSSERLRKRGARFPILRHDGVPLGKADDLGDIPLVPLE